MFYILSLILFYFINFFYFFSIQNNLSPLLESQKTKIKTQIIWIWFFSLSLVNYLTTSARFRFKNHDTTKNLALIYLFFYECGIFEQQIFKPLPHKSYIPTTLQIFLLFCFCYNLVLLDFLDFPVSSLFYIRISFISFILYEIFHFTIIFHSSSCFILLLLLRVFSFDFVDLYLHSTPIAHSTTIEQMTMCTHMQRYYAMGEHMIWVWFSYLITNWECVDIKHEFSRWLNRIKRKR